MTLKLPYISGRDIYNWYKKHDMKVEYKTCQEVAIRARQTEKKVLGNREFRKKESK